MAGVVQGAGRSPTQRLRLAMQHRRRGVGAGLRQPWAKNSSQVSVQMESQGPNLHLGPPIVALQARVLSAHVPTFQEMGLRSSSDQQTAKTSPLDAEVKRLHPEIGEACTPSLRSLLHNGALRSGAGQSTPSGSRQGRQSHGRWVSNSIEGRPFPENLCHTSKPTHMLKQTTPENLP